MPASAGQSSLDRALSAVPPASGAVVMGTGIVSIGLSLDHRTVLSAVVFALAALAWAALGLLLVARLVRDAGRVHREAVSPAALTGVAATAVLGTRVVGFGWDWQAAVLLGLAAGMWLCLIAPVSRNWVTPALGVAFMVAVSTESLAVLAAGLSATERASWLLIVAAVTFVLGLALYLLVLWRFDFRQLLEGRGDHWITGGALAISTLAVTRIAVAARAVDVLGGTAGALSTVSLVIWAITMAWLPLLIAAEVISPRPGYDVRRWASVFPIGMYAACSFDAGAVTGIAGISQFARVWVWVAVAVWLLVVVAMLRRTPRLWSGEAPGESLERVEDVAPSRQPAARR